nr:hypothetical protein [Desulfobacula sp.]
MFYEENIFEQMRPGLLYDILSSYVVVDELGDYYIETKAWRFEAGEELSPQQYHVSVESMVRNNRQVTGWPPNTL